VKRFWLLLLGLFGCGGAKFVDTTVMGVPNIAQVAPRLWRSGQPATADSWAYLAKQLSPGGERVTVVKLNDDAEGSDELVRSMTGWTLVKLPIPPEDDRPWTVLTIPDPREVWTIVQTIVAAYQNGQTVLWHCTAGRDRTSLLSALVGMKLLGWSKTAAWQNMLAHGFRWELPDLDVFWLDDVR
jgi:hypothetical protein